MEFVMCLYREPYEKIRDGKTKVEVRLFDEKRKKLAVGDHITFYKLPEKTEFVRVKIVGLSRFSSFERLFSVFENSLFGYSPTLRMQGKIERNRKIYPLKKEKKWGVLGIHIILI